MTASPLMDRPSSLTLRSVSKAYGATLALDAVDLSIERGEVLALMGANGAGKSTLAKIASGVIQPDHGEIILAGRPIRFASPLAAHQAGVVTVHQSTELLGVASLSVAENLVLGELCGGGFGLTTSARRIRLRAAAVAAGIGLDLPLDQQFGELGPAQRQLVAIARAVATDAKALILDEPTASLAAAEADRLFAVIEQLKTRGVSVLYISHRLGDIRRIADRIVVLRNGRRVADQMAPFDLAGAIRAMIGRDLDSIGAGARRWRARPPHAANRKGSPQVRRRAVRSEPAQRRDSRRRRRVGLRQKPVAPRAVRAWRSRRRNSILLEGEPWRPNSPGQAIARERFLRGRGPLAHIVPAPGDAGGRHCRRDRPAPSPVLVSARNSQRSPGAKRGAPRH